MGRIAQPDVCIEEMVRQNNKEWFVNRPSVGAKELNIPEMYSTVLYSTWQICLELSA